jgi:hypothetical protein
MSAAVGAQSASAALPPAQTNGCAFTGTNTVVPFSISSEYDFTSACNAHDLCYGKPHRYANNEAGRAHCDRDFLAAMQATCNQRFSASNPQRYSCRGKAAVYYQGAQRLGAPWYYDNNTMF